MNFIQGRRGGRPLDGPLDGIVRPLATALDGPLDGFVRPLETAL
jgi:hypothetical protein